MPTAQIPHHDFYVYALFREDGITPFYIGKGRGQRIVIHERQAYRFTSHKDRIIQNMHAAGITDIPKAKLLENMTDPEAKAIEITLIHLLGRWPHGPLANLTSGGDGIENLAPESRAKKSAANVRAWADPAVRQKRIDGIKAVWTPERRAAHSAEKIAATTPEVRAKISASHKKLWESRRKPPKPLKPKRTRKEIFGEFWANPEWREKTQASRKLARAKNPLTLKQRMAGAARLNSKESIAKRWTTSRIPEIRDRRVEAQRKAFSTPEAKAKRSEVSKKMWAAKKAQYALPFENEHES